MVYSHVVFSVHTLLFSVLTCLWLDPIFSLSLQLGLRCTRCAFRPFLSAVEMPPKRCSAAPKKAVKPAKPQKQPAKAKPKPKPKLSATGFVPVHPQMQHCRQQRVKCEESERVRKDVAKSYARHLAFVCCVGVAFV